MALYTSRDGKHLHRASAAGAGDEWVANGPPGSPDYGMMCFCAAGGPLVNRHGQMVLPYLAAPLPGDFHPVPLPFDSKAYVDKKRWWHQRSSLHGVRGSLNTGDFDTTPKRSVGGLVLREDGWAMITPTYEHGRVITKQFVFGVTKPGGFIWTH
eukprot:SAG22_NODE_176_length_16162_cov_30.625910_10_plen_154_part_00